MTYNYADKLSEMDDVWKDTEPAAGGDFDNLPDGDYQVLVDRAEIRESQKGNLMLEWTMKVTGPTHERRLVWRRNMLMSDKNIAFLKRDLATCGVALEKLSDLPAQLDELLDLRLAIALKTKGEFQEVYINELIGSQPKKPPAGDAAPEDPDIPF